MEVIKHLRISVRHDDASHVFDSFINKFKPIRWFAAYENKNTEKNSYSQYDDKDHTNCLICNEEINPHIQAVVVYNNEPTKQQVSAFFKTMPILKNKTEDGKNVAGYYHVNVEKSEGENLIYMMKDGHLITKFGYDKAYLKILEERNKQIIVSKSLSSREKILNKWIEINKIRYPKSKYELFLFIDETYILDWNKSALSMGHKQCYSAYVLTKLHQKIENKNKELYDILMMNIYGIKDHEELIHEIDRDEAIKYNQRQCNEIINCDFIDEDDEIVISTKQLKFNKKYSNNR